MADAIDWSVIDRADPRFFEADPNNTNTNISASRFDPTDPTAKGNPIAEKYNEFLRTANVGDTFDFGAIDPTQKGLSTKFVGFNQMGTPIIQTIQSPDYVGIAPRDAKSPTATFEQIGAMADGTPIYGYGADGKPVTSPTGKIYSITSPQDAITKFSSGSQALVTGNTLTSSTGLKSDAQIAADTAAATAKGERQSAYDLLYSEFSKYGLQSLVAPLKGLITSGASPSEFTIKLRETPEYQKRFAGNAQRIANGLTAIDEATYLAKEDAYQNLMRNYGLPDTYWKKGELGTQDGFTKLIANDVSAVELENRLQTAQQRVTKANPEVAYALKAFYPDITNGDILAYALDPKNALDAINRKVTAAEIGGAALSQGLSTSLGGAEGLAAYGITKDQAQQGYQNVAAMLPRGSQLADIYGQQAYTQGTAEAEVFGTQGAADAKKRREKLISLETAQFGGSSGVGALGRDKAIYGSTQGQTGQY